MKNRKPGRPSRADGPAFPQDELAHILVHGELVPQRDGSARREFPSARALARRYDVSPSTITRFAEKLHFAYTRRARPEREIRPRRDRRAIPWSEIERILVEGEPFQRRDGQLVLVIPETTEISVRFGVSVSTIRRFAKDRRCTERRQATLSPVDPGREEA